MAHDIFISYSTKDKPTADAACATLESAGIRCWIAPRDILPGMEWGDAIVRAISSCRAMVLVFSSNANDSTQIRREVERAVSKGVPVIPLRIEDIAPTHSLEYFIGTVHWLDALTPPLESHLQRLSENVRTLLNNDPNPPRPIPVPPPPVPPPPPAKLPAWVIPAAAGFVVLLGAALWWHSRSPPAAPSFDGGTPGAVYSPAAQAAPTGEVDPGVVGTLEYSTVIDDYDWHFVNKIAADGSYQFSVTQQESGTYQASNGRYQTVGDKTHRVRQGTYGSLDANTLQVTNSAGTVVYRLQNASAQAGAASGGIAGVWQSNVVVNGQPWVLTLRSFANGTYQYEARADDHGTCRIANGTWQSTSAVTGQTSPGTYQVLNAHQVRLTGPAGTGVWERS